MPFTSRTVSCFFLKYKEVQASFMFAEGTIPVFWERQTPFSWDQFLRLSVLRIGRTSSGGAQHAGNYHFGLYELQAKKLRDDQKQA